MSTIAERLAAAVKLVTGMPASPPESRKIDTGAFIVAVERIPYTSRHTFKASRFIVDSAGRGLYAMAECERTSVDAMAGAMREADRRAAVLAAVSDSLTGDGWEIDPGIVDDSSGLTARRAGIVVMICSDGKVISSDIAATIYAEATIKVVEEEVP